MGSIDSVIKYNDSAAKALSDTIIYLSLWQEKNAWHHEVKKADLSCPQVLLGAGG